MAHDVSFRIALAQIMVEKLDSLVMDVETAFVEEVCGQNKERTFRHHSEACRFMHAVQRK